MKADEMSWNVPYSTAV